MKEFDPKSLLKWIPVVIAATVAGIQAIGEQKEQERINDMDERLTKLESEEEGS